MIRVLLMMALVVPLSAFAQPESEPLADDGKIKGYRFGACDQWSLTQTQNGSGYVCSFYPQRIVVADGYDVADALTAADKKIAALEARIVELEKKVGGTTPTP